VEGHGFSRAASSPNQNNQGPARKSGAFCLSEVPEGRLKIARRFNAG
jgi:hypothetical protein